MANEPIYDVASLDCRDKLCTAQTVVETRLLPMGGVSITKVLSYTAESFVSVTDVFAGEARVSGKVTFKVLFLDAGGSCRAMETSADFTDKISGDAIIGGRPEVLHKVLDIDITSVAADEIKLAAIVEMDLFDNISTRVKYLRFGGDNIYTNEQRLEYQKLTAIVRDTFMLSDEIPVQADKILLVESSLVLLSRRAEMDSITVEGQIVTNIIAENNGETTSYRAVTPFSNQSEAADCRPDCHVEAGAILLPVVANLVVGEDDSVVSLEFSVEVNAYVYAHDFISPVSDAFCLTNELSLASADYNLVTNRDQMTIFEKVDGAVTLASDLPIADSILAVAAGKLSVANCYVADERLVIEGAVTSSILYFSKETGTKNSVDVELPFSITTAQSAGGKVVAAFGEVMEISPKIRRADEIDIKCEIAVTVHSVDSQPVRIVSELSVGDMVEIPDSAISLHIARSKESLWDVAKALRTTPEHILLQNPDLQLPLRGGERVMIYRHLKK